MSTEVRESDSSVEQNLYQDQFDPIHSDKGDLDLLGLGNKAESVDARQEQLRSLKASLEDWRLVVLPLVHFLHWQQVWFPGVIVAVNTLLFLLIWYVNISILSTLALLATFLAFADAVVPILASNLLDQHAWTAQQEEEFDSLCQRVLDVKKCIHGVGDRVQQLKLQYPRVFSITLAGVFLLAAIAFDRINNLFLVYLLSTTILLTPGLVAKKVHALAQNHVQQLISTIKSKRNKKQV